MSHPDFKHIGEPVDRVIEEVGELLQAIGRSRRFGLFSHHPDRPESNNLTEIQKEMEDCVDAFFLLASQLTVLNRNHQKEKK